MANAQKADKTAVGENLLKFPIFSYIRVYGMHSVLLNTAIAEATDSERMARAMKLAVEAGRAAFLTGRMPRCGYALASRPLVGTITG